MTIEDLVKLTEMYQELIDEGSIVPAQKLYTMFLYF
jgi:hypothetical protein